MNETKKTDWLFKFNPDLPPVLIPGSVVVGPIFEVADDPLDEYGWFGGEEEEPVLKR